MIQYSSPLLPSLLLLLLILTRLYRGTSIKEASKPSPQVFLKVSKKKTLLLLLEFNRSIRSIRPASIKLQVHEAVLPMAWCWYWCLFGSLPVCVSLCPSKPFSPAAFFHHLRLLYDILALLVLLGLFKCLLVLPT